MSVSQREVADLQERVERLRDDRTALLVAHQEQIAERDRRIAELEQTLRDLRANELEGEPGTWGIRCITDHNAIIDAALAGKEVSRG